MSSIVKLVIAEISLLTFAILFFFKNTFGWSLDVQTIKLESHCYQNSASFEPMLIPTLQDTINLNNFYIKYPGMRARAVVYYLMPLAKGLADTTDFQRKITEPGMSFGTKFCILYSPLICKAKVIKQYVEDTSADSHFFME